MMIYPRKGKISQYLWGSETRVNGAHFMNWSLVLAVAMNNYILSCSREYRAILSAYYKC